MISKRLQSTFRYSLLASKLKEVKNYDTYIRRYLDGSLVLLTGDPAFNQEAFYLHEDQAEYLVDIGLARKEY